MKMLIELGELADVVEGALRTQIEQLALNRELRATEAGLLNLHILALAILSANQLGPDGIGRLGWEARLRAALLRAAADIRFQRSRYGVRAMERIRRFDVAKWIADPVSGPFVWDVSSEETTGE